MRGKLLYVLLFSVIIFTMLSLPSFAESVIPDEFVNGLPDEIKGYMPNTDSYDEFIKSSDTKSILSFTGEVFKAAVNKISGTVIKLVCIILVSSIAECLSKAFNQSVPEICTWIFTLCIAVCTYTLLLELFGSVQDYFEGMNKLITVIGTAMSGIYISGGGSSSAVASAAGTAIIMTVIEKICMVYLLPILRICYAVSISSYISGAVNLKRFSAFIRKCFITVLVLLMTVVTVTLAFQTSLAASSDSVAVRSLRYVTMNTVPIVGGAVGESLRTIASGLSLTKNLCGSYGIIAVLVLALFPIVSLLITKLAFSLCEVFASVFGSYENTGIITDIISLINFMIAIVALFAVVFIIIISLFMKTALAISG